MKNVNADYRDLLLELLFDGVTETNARTGVEIKALAGTRTLTFDLVSQTVPIPANRRYFPRVAAAELAWQLQGTKDPSFIMQYAPKMWEKFVEGGEIKAAYGYRWLKHFGRDQIAMAIKALTNDPSNRQVFVSAWDPMTDGLGQPGPKNIPCPVGFTLSILGNRLNCSVFVRSSDVFVGLPYDIMCYALLVDAMALPLGVMPGKLSMSLAHAHLYKPHWEAADLCAQEKWPAIEPCALPVWSVERIQAEPDRYVQVVSQLGKQFTQHDFHPVPEVVE